MSKNHLVTEIVRETAFTVQSTDRISNAYRLMKSQSLAHITVLEQSEIVGILSRKAIKQLGFGHKFNGLDDVETGIFDMLQAGQVMERDTPQIALPATIREVAELMANGAFTALPVVHENKPIGIVDINDIVLFLLKTP
ncbi:MAG TPA: CBS domain-containing protein [Parapedobacter sp.]|nr:CBS domain-containing protein [Parapedobacter sp.]